MASLKDLRNRINSVKSTQRITSAMKMVAAAKLNRAQEQALAARPYAERMERMLGALAASVRTRAGAPALLAGTGDDRVHLLVPLTSDRGLCGGLNSNLSRRVRQHITRLAGDGREIKILCIGRKGAGILKRDYGDRIVDVVEDVAKPAPRFVVADEIARRIRAMFDAGEFDRCTLFYNHFQSAMTQIVTAQDLIPFSPPEADSEARGDAGAATAAFEYEPSEEEILAELLPRNLAVQLYRAVLEGFASEQGARMTAMESATRNAGEMIDRLSITYNRTRQAGITTELIEIISGAEAL